MIYANHFFMFWKPIYSICIRRYVQEFELELISCPILSYFKFFICQILIIWIYFFDYYSFKKISWFSGKIEPSDFSTIEINAIHYTITTDWKTIQFKRLITQIFCFIKTTNLNKGFMKIAFKWARHQYIYHRSTILTSIQIAA